MFGQLTLTYIIIIIIIIIIMIIVISLVNSAVSITDYTTSDDRIRDKRTLSWQVVEGRDCGFVLGGPLS
jgi:choline-glycine betaine transporter